jgi:ribonuclease HII
MVICGFAIDQKDEKKLISLKVKDSKLLQKHKREELFEGIKKLSYKSEIIVIGPEEIDKAVYKEDGLNLNWLEAKKTAVILNSIQPNKAIIDAPSNNIPNYKDYLKGLLNHKQIELILEHKADFNYPIVSAASILAKVTRDKEIDALKEKIGIDFGSGYMSDPKTVKFLKKYHDKYSSIFRKSWFPYKKIIQSKFQSNLGDFSKFIGDVEHNNKNMLGKLKKLEDLGYKFIPVSTEHENVRMKGACTITLYKSGKLLIQGNKQSKELVEKILK